MYKGFCNVSHIHYVRCSRSIFDGSVEKWIAVSIWYQDLALFRENRSDWHRIIEFSMSSRLKDFLLPVMMC